MEELIKRMWQWLKESPAWIKVTFPLLIAILVICVLLSGCGTIGWISAKDTANATISITNTPETNVTTDAEVPISLDAPISVPSIEIFDGSDADFKKLENGFYVFTSKNKSIRYEQTTEKAVFPSCTVSGSNGSKQVPNDRVQGNSAAIPENQFLSGSKAQFPQMRVLYRE